MLKINTIAKRGLAAALAVFAIITVFSLPLIFSTGGGAFADTYGTGFDYSGPDNDPDADGVEITVEDTVYDYDNQPHSPTVTVTVNDIPHYIFTIEYVLKDGSLPASGDPPVNAGEYEYILTVDLTSWGIADPRVVEGDFTINRIEPTITFNNLEQTYSHYTNVTAEARGLYGDGFFDDEFTIEIEGITGPNPDAGSYTVTAEFPGSENYLPKTVQANLVVKPKEVGVTFLEQWEFDYNAQVQTRPFNYSKTVFPEEEGSITAEYSVYESPVKEAIDPINAGRYDITLTIDNPNYVIGKVNGGLQMRINKRPLTISLNNITILKGETPHFTFSYSGFAGDEDARYLNTPPYIDQYPAEPGVYSLVPTGATAANYNIAYAAGILTINETEMNQHIEGKRAITIYGSFSPDTDLSFVPLTPDSELIEILKNRSQIYFESDIEKAYDLKFTTGGMSGATRFKVTLYNIKLSPFFIHKVCVIDKNGNYYKIENYVYRDQTLSFNTYTDGQVIIYRSSLLTYIGAGFIGLIGLIILSYKISSHLTYKKQKKEGPPKKEQKKKPKYEW